MRGLSIVVAGPDPVRYRSALSMAAAAAALGGAVRLLLDQAAVMLAHSEAELVHTCFELGVAIDLCQTGLAAAGLDASRLDDRFSFGGMIGFLAALGEDHLVIA
jgi:predicted peroxiredoxin